MKSDTFKVYIDGSPVMVPQPQWESFKNEYLLIEAAGGLVFNPQNELLAFFRRDSWDLPKGKIDPGETPEQAAIREVEEETGLSALVLGRFLTHTYHTYEHKGKQVLKKTWWYLMHTTETNTTPQTEEDIEEIKWVNPGEWVNTEDRIYGNIVDIIHLTL